MCNLKEKRKETETLLSAALLTCRLVDFSVMDE